MKKTINFAKNRIYAYSIVLLSISLVLGYIEVMIPINAGFLGVKIGLSNIVSIICVRTIGIKKAIIINLLRIIIFGILFGNITRFLISLFGFIVSFIVLIILLKLIKCSILISSIFAAVFHNISQLVCVSFLVKNINILSILPFYIFFGIISGVLVGIISTLCIKYIDKLHLKNYM